MKQRYLDVILRQTWLSNLIFYFTLSGIASAVERQENNLYNPAEHRNALLQKNLESLKFTVHDREMVEESLKTLLSNTEYYKDTSLGVLEQTIMWNAAAHGHKEVPDGILRQGPLSLAETAVEEFAWQSEMLGREMGDKEISDKINKFRWDHERANMEFLASCDDQGDRLNPRLTKKIHASKTDEKKRYIQKTSSRGYPSDYHIKIHERRLKNAAMNLFYDAMDVKPITFKLMNIDAYAKGKAKSSLNFIGDKLKDNVTTIQKLLEKYGERETTEIQKEDIKKKLISIVKDTENTRVKTIQEACGGVGLDELLACSTVGYWALRAIDVTATERTKYYNMISEMKDATLNGRFNTGVNKKKDTNAMYDEFKRLEKLHKNRSTYKDDKGKWVRFDYAVLQNILRVRTAHVVFSDTLGVHTGLMSDSWQGAGMREFHDLRAIVAKYGASPAQVAYMALRAHITLTAGHDALIKVKHDKDHLFKKEQAVMIGPLSIDDNVNKWIDNLISHRNELKDVCYNIERLCRIESYLDNNQKETKNGNLWDNLSKTLGTQIWETEKDELIIKKNKEKKATTKLVNKKIVSQLTFYDKFNENTSSYEKDPTKSLKQSKMIEELAPVLNILQLQQNLASKLYVKNKPPSMRGDNVLK